MEIISGIYKITNLINKKIYIGQSTDIYRRWNEHKSRSQSLLNNDSNCPLYVAMRKYGIKNFKFEIIEQIEYLKLNEREIYWIAYYNSYNNGYNATLGGNSGKQYDYSKIFALWNQGYLCKEIEQILHCSDQVITKALRLYEITEEEVRSRSNISKSRPVIAIDIITKQSLKVFKNEQAAYLYVTKNQFYKKNGAIYKAIHAKNKYYGYYWDYLSDNNAPNQELTEEEFFQYQQSNFSNFSKEIIEKLSISNRKVERCSREELKQLIREKSFIEIGKIYNVSDNAIRKWCDYYQLPRRKKDINIYTNDEWQTI